MRFIAILAIAAISSSSTIAQAQSLTTTSPAPAASAPAPAAAAPEVKSAMAAGPMTLPAGSEVMVSVVSTIDSKKSKAGVKFKIVTAQDVLQDGAVAIPKGTPGEATVTAVIKAGSFGKAGKMEISFNSLDLNGQKVPLNGRFRQEGKGNGGAAAAGVVAAGLVGGFLIKGKRAEIEPAQRMRAKTVEALTFTGTAVAAPAAGTQ